MDGRNRAVKQPPPITPPLNKPVPVYHRMPEGLRVLVIRYQNDRGIISFAQAIIELLETHPSIARQLDKVYNEASSIQDRKDLPP